MLTLSELGMILLIGLVLLGIVAAMRGTREVPQGVVWTVERFRAFTRLLSRGTNFIIPYQPVGFGAAVHT
jgi:regulator of protease activity HflC (stomatin/prohibitin superfamily)